MEIPAEKNSKSSNTNKVLVTGGTGFLGAYIIKELIEKGYAVRAIRRSTSKLPHFIPSEIIKRRYFKGLQNLKKYLNLVNDWFLLDNSKSDYKIIARSFNLFLSL